MQQSLSFDKIGTLILGNQFKSVSILHRNPNGDALIFDGTKIFMMQTPFIVEHSSSDSSSCDKERIMLVKKLYKKLLAGEIDDQVLRTEIMKRQ